MKDFNTATDSIGPDGRTYTIYWVCEDNRVPLELGQIFGAGDTWHLYGGGYNIINIYPRHGEYYYHDLDYGVDDVQALVDIITGITGEGFKQVIYYQLGERGPVARYPPSFEPVFRDKQAEASYYRYKAKQAREGH